MRQGAATAAAYVARTTLAWHLTLDEIYDTGLWSGITGPHAFL